MPDDLNHEQRARYYLSRLDERIRFQESPANTMGEVSITFDTLATIALAHATLALLEKDRR
jgi:hypothetical protein